MKLFKGLVPTTLLLICCINSSAIARDISGRMGAGFVNQFSNSSADRPVPAISVKYGISRDTGILGAFGFNTRVPAAMTLGGKLFKNLFMENNLNFYVAAGLAYVKQSVAGVDILGLFGAEYFIPGIESLGLSFESGVSASNGSGSMELSSVGYVFMNAGVHFYF